MLRLSSKRAKWVRTWVHLLPSGQEGRPRGVGVEPGAGPGLEDMSLEVSGMDDSGQKVLELDRGLVAVEEIHAACGDGDRQGSIRIPMTPSLLATQAVNPNPTVPPDTPKFCRNSDLTPICSSWFSNRTPLFLHTNLGGGVGSSG